MERGDGGNEPGEGAGDMEGHGGGEAPVSAAAAPSPAKGGKVEFGGVCLWDYWVGDWLCFVGTISWWGLCRG